MRALLRTVAAMAFICALTVLFSRFFFEFPERFPTLPDQIWSLADEAAGGTTYENQKDAELLVVVIVSFGSAVAVGLVSYFVARLVLRRIRRRVVTGREFDRG